MALKVYKGNGGSGQYENKFFDSFQQVLKNIFEKKGYNGVLIGFPEPKAPRNRSFQPDCVLITENRVVIIDFKNFADGTVRLPEPYCFDSAPWIYTGKDGKREVKGGSHSNPLAQLKCYRRELEKLYGGRINEHAGGIGLLVIFHGKIEIQGEIPKNKENLEKHFDIADSFNYPKKLLYMIELDSRDRNNIEELRRKFFGDVQKYELNINLGSSDADRKKVEEAQAKVEKLNIDLAKIKKEYNEQINENKRLRDQGEEVAEGIRLIKEKEEELKRKEEEIEDAKQDFDEKRKLYEMAMANVEREIERTKQAEAARDVEIQRTKQAEAARDVEREKTAQVHESAEATKYQADLRHKFTKALIAIIIFILFMVIVFYVKSQIEENQEREQAEQAIIEDKKAGKTCIGLSEVSDYQRIKNVCVEFIVGDVAQSDYRI